MSDCYLGEVGSLVEGESMCSSENRIFKDLEEERERHIEGTVK